MNDQYTKIKNDIDRINLECNRSINLIVLHCSATPEGRDVSASEIREWHMRDRGFTDIGYHFVVRLDGTVEAGRPLDRPGAHCRKHNLRSIGVCYIGGADKNLRSKDTRTPAQKAAIEFLTNRLLAAFPEATVKKHRELAATACPGY